ncbi:MAG TPA: TonB-dependent receptor, partial [Kofleriaceae bacterium]|nr:TonB-dependent receptor [Kofleriaceae bacterium]
MASAQPTPPDNPPDTPPDNPTPPAAPSEAPPAEPPASPPPEAPAEPAAPAAPSVGTITGTIRAPDLDGPLGGVTVTIEGTDLTAITDEHGRFTLSAPPGRVKLRAEISGFQPSEKELTLSAGETADVDFPLELHQIGEVVVVVGSRTPRTNVETTAPVDVVTSEEINHVGRTETGRILSTLAPSFVSNPQTVADGTDHVDPASLRGLGPDQTLILINGKRRHKSALLNVNGTFGRGTVGTDLNAIPAGSIKRIEILRDGAASQYGSDAIAGVINIVTKDYTGLLDMTTLTGITGSGDGEQIKTSANYGFKLGKRGFLNITGELLEKNPTNRAGSYTGNVFTDPKVDKDLSQDNALLAMKGLTRDDFGMRIGEAGAENAMSSYTMELPIDEASTFYSFGDLSHRSGDAAGFYRYPFQTTQNVAAFYPNGFLPEIHSSINDLGVTIGIRRKGDWNVDASLTHGRNSFQFNVENSVNASLGTSSPTSFDAGTLSAQETLADVDLLRKIPTTVVKSLAFVLGTEIRLENYKITAGDLASYAFGGLKTDDMPPKVTAPGAQVFPGFQPSNEVDRDRRNVGVYTGLESEVVKGVNVDVGGRYEHYSDFGNAVTGKVAARVPVTREVAARGAVSTGFRAPSLQQLWFSNVSSLFIADSTGALVPNQVLTSNNASPI